MVTTASASEGIASRASLPKGNYVLTGWVRGNAGGETYATGGTGGAGARTRNDTLATTYFQIVLPFSVRTPAAFVGIFTASATVRTFFVDAPWRSLAIT